MSSRPSHDTEVTLRSHRYAPAMVVGALALLVALFAASPALAGTVTNTGTTISFSDSSDATNDVTFTPRPSSVVRVHDIVALTGTGCSKVDDFTVDCTAPLLSEIDASLGAGNDQVRTSVSGVAANFDGGPGGDFLQGANG